MACAGQSSMEETSVFLVIAHAIATARKRQRKYRAAKRGPGFLFRDFMVLGVRFLPMLFSLIFETSGPLFDKRVGCSFIMELLQVSFFLLLPLSLSVLQRRCGVWLCLVGVLWLLIVVIILWSLGGKSTSTWDAKPHSFVSSSPPLPFRRQSQSRLGAGHKGLDILRGVSPDITIAEDSCSFFFSPSHRSRGTDRRSAAGQEPGLGS